MVNDSDKTLDCDNRWWRRGGNGIADMPFCVTQCSALLRPHEEGRWTRNLHSLDICLLCWQVPARRFSNFTSRLYSFCFLSNVKQTSSDRKTVLFSDELSKKVHQLPEWLSISVLNLAADHSAAGQDHVYFYKLCLSFCFLLLKLSGVGEGVFQDMNVFLVNHWR